MIFLKLDFLKSCDKMDWEFFFKCMGNLVVFKVFVNMKKIIFTKAKANLIVNKNLPKILKSNLTHLVKVPFGSLFVPNFL